MCKSLQIFDLLDGVEDDGFLFQKAFHLLVLLDLQFLGDFVSVWVINVLQQVTLEGSQFIQFFVESFKFFIEVDMGTQLEEDFGGGNIGNTTALRHFLLLGNDVNL
jgi:hypothetical protein